MAHISAAQHAAALVCVFLAVGVAVITALRRRWAHARRTEAPAGVIGAAALGRDLSRFRGCAACLSIPRKPHDKTRAAPDFDLASRLRAEPCRHIQGVEIILCRAGMTGRDAIGFVDAVNMVFHRNTPAVWNGHRLSGVSESASAFDAAGDHDHRTRWASTLCDSAHSRRHCPAPQMGSFQFPPSMLIFWPLA